MEKPIRRVMRLDPIDEKMEFLTDKGIFLLGGEIDIMTYFGLFTGIVPRLYSRDIKEIWIVMDSPGGSIIHGFAIYDLFKAIAKQGVGVNILGSGMIASMAVCIMQAGTKRYATPSTQFTIHQASMSGEGERQEVNQLMENVKELERLNGIVMNIVAERSGMDLKKLMGLSKKTDYSLGADKAKKFGKNGLIDEIVTGFPFPIPKKG